MRRITVPDPITIANLNGDEMKLPDGAVARMNFEQFVFDRLSDPAWAKLGMKGILQVAEIRDKVRAAENGYLDLENSDWETLSQVTKDPSEGAQYDSRVAHNFLDFMRAIVEAPILKADQSEE